MLTLRRRPGLRSWARMPAGTTETKSEQEGEGCTDLCERASLFSAALCLRVIKFRWRVPKNNTFPIQQPSVLRTEIRDRHVTDEQCCDMRPCSDRWTKNG
jgi:hypothetical protein